MKKMFMCLSFCLAITGCASSNIMSESEVLALVAELRTLNCSDLALRQSEYQALWTAGHLVAGSRTRIAEAEFNRRCKK
jgi:hypothetical protein